MVFRVNRYVGPLQEDLALHTTELKEAAAFRASRASLSRMSVSHNLATTQGQGMVVSYPHLVRVQQAMGEWNEKPQQCSPQPCFPRGHRPLAPSQSLRSCRATRWVSSIKEQRRAQSPVSTPLPRAVYFLDRSDHCLSEPTAGNLKSHFRINTVQQQSGKERETDLLAFTG